MYAVVLSTGHDSCLISHSEMGFVSIFEKDTVRPYAGLRLFFMYVFEKISTCIIESEL